MKGKDFLKKIGIHPTELIYWDLENKRISLDELLDDFASELSHKTKEECDKCEGVFEKSKLNFVDKNPGVILCDNCLPSQPPLPKVNDWDKLWEKYRFETSNEDAWQFFLWVRNNHSAPASPSDEMIKEIKDKIRNIISTYKSGNDAVDEIFSICSINPVSPSDEEIKNNLIGFAYQYDVCESNEEKDSVCKTFISNIRSLFTEERKQK